MNLTEEVALMIDEMRARTGEAPASIICNQETLNRLWTEGRGVYAGEINNENSTGYVSKFMGIRIKVSPQVETGKLLMIPSPNTIGPFRVEYLGEPLRIEKSGTIENWWIRSPLSAGTGGEWFDVQYHPSPPRMPAAGDTEAEINEDSFMAIITGNDGDMSA